MKRFFTFSLLVFISAAYAQQAITPEEYERKKSAGQLDPGVNYTISPQRNTHAAPARYSGPVQAQSTLCNCIVPLDTTFFVVPFQNANGPDFRNDDGSSPVLALPFAFNFYGTLYDSIYINNNGNISFGTSYGTFTSMSFPTATFSMIAPYWADVDTRNALSGLVYYQLTPTHLIVKWDSVGYYANHANITNTFQLIITDGTDTILPPGSNVSFCYGDMNWTTGDASSGVGGFGGFPATIGCNQGNGVDYFQVTQCDQAGLAFDGPYGANDGSDWLDNQEIYFNTSLSGNVPPLVMNSTICDTIDVYTGDTLRMMSSSDSVSFDFYFMTPEINQNVSATITCSTPSALTTVQTQNSSPYKSYTCTFHANHNPPGIYTVTGTATDDGSPSAQTSQTVYIHSYYDPALTTGSIAPPAALSLYPNPAGDVLTLEKPFAAGSTFTITDVLGQTVTRGNITGTKTEINTTALQPGTYFITINAADGSAQTMKFVRE